MKEGKLPGPETPIVKLLPKYADVLTGSKAADINIESRIGQISRWDLAAAVDLIKVGRMAAEDALAKHWDQVRKIIGRGAT